MSTHLRKFLLSRHCTRRIWLSDAIFVENVDAYIGDSTRGEIEYARALGKDVWYYR